MCQSSSGLRNFLIFSIPSVFFFNEYLIYYLAFFNCDWPIDNNDATTNIMILSDTHLLGVRHGHWFDKLRREWQMRRSFQTSMSLFGPDAVFFLGDLFDEGQWGDNEQFEIYTNRFNELFHVPEGVKRFTVVGNHDIGFHYAISQHNMDRFARNFGLERGVEHVELNGNHFVLFNSMALEGDYCQLCSKALSELDSIASSFQCALSNSSGCKTSLKTPYSRPIILQHFPLYRTSDIECLKTDDLAPAYVREDKFRPKWDCLSSESTNLLLEKLRPRAVFGGHVHYGCQRWWTSPFNFWEYTVSSFSWRNNKHPSFLLVSISPQQMYVNRCFVPHEDVVIYTYAVFAIIWSICSLVLLRTYFSQILKLKNRWNKPERFTY